MASAPNVYKVTDANGDQTYVAARTAEDTLTCQPDWDEFEHLPATIARVDEDAMITVNFEDDEFDDVPQESEHVIYRRSEAEVEAPAWAWALHFASRAPTAICSERWEF